MVQVAAQSELPVGKERLAFYKGKNVLVVHTKNGFVGFSAIDGALLKWDEEREQIVCLTDDSIFDTQGNKVSGRAEYPLQAYQVKVNSERVYLTGRLFLKESKEYAE
jgi:nitrite reductase/ring-hydroxylating ferredoxin subunit